MRMAVGIVDFQCHVSSDRNVFKELCIVRADASASSSHWIFTSPKPTTNLSSKQEKTNKWLAERFHGLSYNYGEVPYEEMKKILDVVTPCFDLLLVKGAEKCKTLNHILPYVKIYNIESLGCPPLRKLKSLTNEMCLYHNLKNKNFICSKAQAISMVTWYRLQSQNGVDFLIRFKQLGLLS
jgi:hypothetical protein